MRLYGKSVILSDGLMGYKISLNQRERERERERDLINKNQKSAQIWFIITHLNIQITPKYLSLLSFFEVLLHS